MTTNNGRNDEEEILRKRLKQTSADEDANPNIYCKSNEEEILRKRLKPTPTVEEVIDVIRKYYYFNDHDGDRRVDIQVVKELDSYDDYNLWVTVDGENFLVKVHNGVESRDMLQHLESNNNDDNDDDEKEDYRKSAIYLQHAIMVHLNDSGITTNKPRIVKRAPAALANNSSNFKMPSPVAFVSSSLPVVSSEESPTLLVVRLLSWVDGKPMSSSPILPIELLADAGRFLGRLGKALSSLPDRDHLIASQRYHQWDGKNTADLKDFVKYVTDDRQRSMIESIILAFQTDILDNIEEISFETSIIHGDFNDANILLNENFQVSGVIDFGDSVESWSILDLSVALAYSMMNSYGKRDRMLSAASSMLRGYHSVRPVAYSERRYLPLLIACRLACSATLGAYSYSQNPENEYLLLHAKPAWYALELIWGTDQDRREKVHASIYKLFDLACSSSSSSSASFSSGSSGNDDKRNEAIDCTDLSFPDPIVADSIAGIRIV